MKFVVIKDQGKGPAYLCSGGGSFTWWTVHKSMASKLTKEEAVRLVKLGGGRAHEVKMG